MSELSATVIIISTMLILHLGLNLELDLLSEALHVTLTRENVRRGPKNAKIQPLTFNLLLHTHSNTQTPYFSVFFFPLTQ